LAGDDRSMDKWRSRIARTISVSCFKSSFRAPDAVQAHRREFLDRMKAQDVNLRRSGFGARTATQHARRFQSVGLPEGSRRVMTQLVPTPVDR
jgi:hypothetical protein